MRVKVLSLMAALLLVAGCETEQQDTAQADTGGTEMTTMEPQDTGGIVPGSQEDLVVNVGDRIFFDFDKSDLRPDAIETLNRQSDWLRSFPSVTVTIEGHCDERGTREYNLALGERRAASARQYLESTGISGGRLDTISYGKERPAVLGSNEAAWAQNRRAVMVVKSGPGA